MGGYKDRQNYVDHDFNNTTLTINGEHNAEGLESLEVTYNEPRSTVSEVADGMAIFNVNNSKTGTIKFSIMESSATCDIMWDLWAARSTFPVAVLDTASPNLSVSAGQCRFGELPPIKRSGEVDVVEFTLNATYMDARGGSYSLVSA